MTQRHKWPRWVSPTMQAELRKAIRLDHWGLDEGCLVNEPYSEDTVEVRDLVTAVANDFNLRVGFEPPEWHPNCLRMLFAPNLAFLRWTTYNRFMRWHGSKYNDRQHKRILSHRLWAVVKNYYRDNNKHLSIGRTGWTAAIHADPHGVLAGIPVPGRFHSSMAAKQAADKYISEHDMNPIASQLQSLYPYLYKQYA